MITVYENDNDVYTVTHICDVIIFHLCHITLSAFHRPMLIYFVPGYISVVVNILFKSYFHTFQVFDLFVHNKFSSVTFLLH